MKATERQIQRSIIELLRTILPGGIVAHVPNEGVRGGNAGLMDGKKRKADGVLPGYPDLICHYQGRTFGLEVKPEGARLSDYQKGVRDAFEANGIPYAVVRSHEDVIEALEEWGVEFRGVIS